MILVDFGFFDKIINEFTNEFIELILFIFCVILTQKQKQTNIHTMLLPESSDLMKRIYLDFLVNLLNEFND